MHSDAGVVKYNDDFYYVGYSGEILQNATQLIDAKHSNGILEPGTYYFEKDGKLRSNTELRVGMDGALYYYQNGRLCSGIYNGELIEHDGAIYWVKWSGKVAVNETREVTIANANGVGEAGIYIFDKDGKGVRLPDTGVGAGADGTLYYYQDGKIGSGIYNGKLIEHDGAIYWVKWSGKVAVNETREVTSANSNGLVEPNSYYFDEDGKMVR